MHENGSFPEELLHIKIDCQVSESLVHNTDSTCWWWSENVDFCPYWWWLWEDCDNDDFLVLGTEESTKRIIKLPHSICLCWSTIKARYKARGGGGGQCQQRSKSKVVCTVRQAVPGRIHRYTDIGWAVFQMGIIRRFYGVWYLTSCCLVLSCSHLTSLNSIPLLRVWIALDTSTCLRSVRASNPNVCCTLRSMVVCRAGE